MLIRRRLIRILDDRRTVHARLSPRRRPAGLLVLALVVLAFGRPRDVAGRLANDRPPSQPRAASRRPPGAAGCEPASYRPGTVWHRDAAGPRERRRHRRAAGGRAGPGVLAGRLDPGFGRRRRGRRAARCGHGPGRRPPRGAPRCRRLPGVLARRQDAGHRQLRPDRQALGRRLAAPEGRRSRGTPTGSSPWPSRPTAASLASAGHDKTVRVWDVATGRETATLAGHSASVRAVGLRAASEREPAGLRRSGSSGLALGPEHPLAFASGSTGTRARSAPWPSRPMAPRWRPAARTAR